MLGLRLLGGTAFSHRHVVARLSEKTYLVGCFTRPQLQIRASQRRSVSQISLRGRLRGAKIASCEISCLDYHFVRIFLLDGLTQSRILASRLGGAARISLCAKRSSVKKPTSSVFHGA